MSHEATVDRAQLHLFDDAGSFCAGLTEGERAESVLLDVLDRVNVPRPVLRPGPDVVIPADRVPLVAESIRSALRDAIKTTALGDVNDAYDQAVIEVLGKPTTIRIRNPRHYELKRLNDLYSGIERAAEARRSIDIFAVPHLDEIDRAVLTAVRDGTTQAQLPGVLEQHFVHLATATSNAETGALMRQHAATVNDDNMLALHVARLEDWNLLQRAEGGTLMATRKLMTIRF